jgi:hypothetical protein
MPPDHLDVEVIRAHYDRVSPYSQALWGEHLHHSQWEDGEPPAAAQVKLTGPRFSIIRDGDRRRLGRRQQSYESGAAFLEDAVVSRVKHS